MIVPFIETIASEMTADDFTFLHSNKDWQNVQADDLTPPFMFLDFPIQGEPIHTASGALVDNYIMVMLFLYKTELDDEKSVIRAAVDSAQTARREFILRVKEAETDDDATFYKSTFGKWIELENEFDSAYSGVMQPFNIQLRPSGGYCL